MYIYGNTLHDDPCTSIAILYMMIHVHLWQYLGEFFLALEIHQTEVEEKIKAHFLLSLLVTTNALF
jgi:hypothetical protein